MLAKLASSAVLYVVGELAENYVAYEERTEFFQKRRTKRMVDRRRQAGERVYDGPVFCVQVDGGPREGLYFCASEEDAKDILASVVGYMANKRAIARGELRAEQNAGREAHARAMLGPDGPCIPWTCLPHSPEWHRQEAFRKGRLYRG